MVHLPAPKDLMSPESKLTPIDRSRAATSPVSNPSSLDSQSALSDIQKPRPVRPLSEVSTVASSGEIVQYSVLDRSGIPVNSMSPVTKLVTNSVSKRGAKKIDAVGIEAEERLFTEEVVEFDADEEDLVEPEAFEEGKTGINSFKFSYRY